MKIGAKVVAHGCYLVLQMAEVAVPRELFGRILDRIARLRPPDLAPMVTLDGRGAVGGTGRRDAAEVRPWGAQVESEKSPKPVAGVKRAASLAQEPDTLAFDATRAVSRLRDGDRPSSSGNV